MIKRAGAGDGVRPPSCAGRLARVCSGPTLSGRRSGPRPRARGQPHARPRSAPKARMPRAPWARRQRTDHRARGTASPLSRGRRCRGELDSERAFACRAEKRFLRGKDGPISALPYLRRHGRLQSSVSGRRERSDRPRRPSPPSCALRLGGTNQVSAWVATRLKGRPGALGRAWTFSTRAGSAHGGSLRRSSLRALRTERTAASRERESSPRPVGCRPGAGGYCLLRCASTSSISCGSPTPRAMARSP